VAGALGNMEVDSGLGPGHDSFSYFFWKFPALGQTFGPLVLSVFAEAEDFRQGKFPDETAVHNSSQVSVGCELRIAYLRNYL
jgi:hypothetical protein